MIDSFATILENENDRTLRLWEKVNNSTSYMHLRHLDSWPFTVVDNLFYVSNEETSVLGWKRKNFRKSVKILPLRLRKGVSSIPTFSPIPTKKFPVYGKW